MRPPRPGGAGSRCTPAQQRYPLRYITILDLNPPATDRFHRTPVGETLLGRHRNQLIHPLAEGCVVSDEQTQPDAGCQVPSQRRRMSQPPSLSDCRAAPFQCLVRIAEAGKDNPQIRRWGVEPDLMAK